MLHELSHLMLTAARKTGEVWPESWREAARGLILSLYQGADLNTITIYCGVLLILGIIGAILIITFAAVAKRRADLFYLNRMGYTDGQHLHLHRSVR